MDQHRQREAASMIAAPKSLATEGEGARSGRESGTGCDGINTLDLLGNTK